MTDDDDTSQDYVWVLGLDDEDPSADEVRAWSFLPARAERAAIPVDRLEQQMRDFVSAVQRIVGGIPRAVGAYEVESITIAAEISAKGKVSFLGSGGELAGKGGITFTLTKRGRTTGQFPAGLSEDDDDGGAPETPE
jgi:hypothetical protein